MPLVQKASYLPLTDEAGSQNWGWVPRERERVCVCMCASIYECIYVCVYVYMYAYVSECIYVYICLCVWVFMYRCVFMCICLCVRSKSKNGKARVTVSFYDHGDLTAWIGILLSYLNVLVITTLKLGEFTSVRHSEQSSLAYWRLDVFKLPCHSWAL